jgi:hypothetical protein
MYPYSFYAGTPGQVLADQWQYRGEWQRDYFGRYFVAYRPMHLLTVSRGPWAPPVEIPVG